VALGRPRCPQLRGGRLHRANPALLIFLSRFSAGSAQPREGRGCWKPGRLPSAVAGSVPARWPEPHHRGGPGCLPPLCPLPGWPSVTQPPRQPRHEGSGAGGPRWGRGRGCPIAGRATACEAGWRGGDPRFSSPWWRGGGNSNLRSQIALGRLHSGSF